MFFSNTLLMKKKIYIYLQEKGKGHLERMFSDVLAEKTVATKDAVETTRTPYYDDTTKKILSEPSFHVLCQFEDEMRACFVSYMSENYAGNRLMLSWKELALENKRMSIFGFIRFLKEAALVPNYLSVEIVEEILLKTVPPVVPKENDFYHRHKVV